MGDGFYAAEIIFQIEMLVGCVSVFIRQAEADENTRDLERVVHLSDEGDGTAFANENRFFLETFLESSLGALKNGSVVRSGPGFACTENLEFAVHGFGQKFANVFFDELGDALRILAGDQARGKFRIGLSGNYGFCAFALIAAPHAVEFESRTYPELFDGGETSFAAIGGSADGFLKCFSAPRQGVKSFAFGLGELFYVVVESGNGDAEIFVVKFCEQFREKCQWIGNGTAIDAGVKVAHGAGQLDLVIVQSAQAVGDRRDAFAEHGSIGDDERIGFEFFFIFLNEIPEADATDFLFALDENFDIDGKFSGDLVQGLKSFEMDVDLSFVVGGTARVNVAVANGGFERGSGPKVQGFGRLNVVMSIEQDGWFAGRVERFGIDERVQRRGNDFNRFKSSGTEIVGDPAGSALDVGLVFGLGADAGDAKKLVQFCKMLLTA